MFKKVLIVDDHDDINNGVFNILNNHDVEIIQKAQYCDEAYLKIRKATLDGNDFDLLITDLSFKKDHRSCTLSSGEELIASLKREYPELTIIVYSMDNRLQKVRTLINTHQVNAYVCKDRKGSIELSQAISTVYKTLS